MGSVVVKGPCHVFLTRSTRAPQASHSEGWAVDGRRAMATASFNHSGATAR